MTKNQEEQYQKYINKAKKQKLKWIAIDPDGRIFGYKYKPFWNSTLNTWDYDNMKENTVMLGANKKLAHYCLNSLRKIESKNSDNGSAEGVDDFDVEDFLEKQNLARFTQEERLDQICSFKQNLIIHDSAFKGHIWDLDDYQKEFTVIGNLFALRFHYIDDKKRHVGFQLFIEDDGYFALWNNESDIPTDWISDLLYVLTRGWSLLIDSAYND